MIGTKSITDLFGNVHWIELSLIWGASLYSGYGLYYGAQYEFTFGAGVIVGAFGIAIAQRFRSSKTNRGEAE